jgi:hypothetical protein
MAAVVAALIRSGMAMRVAARVANAAIWANFLRVISSIGVSVDLPVARKCGRFWQVFRSQ